jgi:1,4-alpha-glucan branching enzyme
VSNYLISNALYWLEEYHIDGMRVDAVASMLYRDFSREAGQWIPNKDGGRENYEVIAALQRTNTICYGQVPGIMTVAEESSTFPGVTRPVDSGGLGFGFKWNMGWMNDTLAYMKKDPLFRKYNHNLMTFASSYAWSENFVLPISHDEVVHGKGSMLGKMPGNAEEKFANLRAFYGFMWGHPGKKLLFMGQEFAQGAEWNHNQSLDWHQLALPAHAGVQTLIRDLNRVLRENAALYVNDSRYEGFEWIDADDAEGSTYAWLRKGKLGDPMIAVVCNMTPVERRMRLGLPATGSWTEILNTDSAIYGGGNRGNMGLLNVEPVAWNRMAQSAMVTLPPLSAVYFRHD